MFNSLKRWLNTPITIKPFISRSATGDKIFGDSIGDIKCYPQSEFTVVRNWQGVEVISNTKLHVDGSIQITDLDNVIYEGKEYPVQAISCYYNAKGGIDIKVVYI